MSLIVSGFVALIVDFLSVLFCLDNGYLVDRENLLLCFVDIKLCFSALEMLVFLM